MTPRANSPGDLNMIPRVHVIVKGENRFSISLQDCTYTLCIHTDDGDNNNVL